MRSPRTVSSAGPCNSITSSVPRPPRHWPAPPESGAQARAVHDERVLRLERLDLRDHRTATEEVAAGGVGAVDAVAPAHTAEVVEEVHPGLAVVTDPGERVHVDQRARCDLVVGERLRHRAEDRLDRPR